MQYNRHRADIAFYCLMLNLERCKDILNKGIKKFSNDEVKEIRDYLYQIADMELSLADLQMI